MRPAALVCAVVGVCALSATAVASAPPFGTRLPPGWSRVGFSLTLTSDPVERYAAASFRLHRVSRDAGCVFVGEGVRRQMPPNGVIVDVVEWVGSTPPVPRDFPSLSIRPSLGRAANLDGCYGWAYNVPLRIGRRAFQAFVLVRARPGARHLKQARDLLGSLRIGSRNPV